jgi:prepilin-type N-terminal cleavage/methylation domain-containing protein
MSIEGGQISLDATDLSVEQPMVGQQKGFTLIEVLIVAAVVGTLAAVAIPQFAGAKEKAYVTAMQADLHIIALYQEQFAAENHGQYFSGTATPDTPLNGFTPSKDVTVTATAFNILGSRLADWIAIAKHSKTSQSCEIRGRRITCTTGNALTFGLFGN